MSIILLVAQPGTIQENLENWGHQVLPTSHEQMLAIWPPKTADLLLVDEVEEQLPLIERLRRIENSSGKPPFPKLGIGWTQADRWPAYKAGLDACLGHEPEELKALLPCPEIWAGHAFDAEFALTSMGHISIVEQMIEVFLAETPREFNQLQTVYEDSKSSRSGTSPNARWGSVRSLGSRVHPWALAKAAHRFAGGLAIWGQIPALRAALALEQAAEHNASTDDLFLVLQQALTRLLQTLDHLGHGRDLEFL